MEKKVEQFTQRFNLQDGQILNTHHTPETHQSYMIYDRENLKTVILKIYTFEQQEDIDRALNHLEKQEGIFLNEIHKNQEILTIKSNDLGRPNYFLALIQQQQPNDLQTLIDNHKRQTLNNIPDFSQEQRVYSDDDTDNLRQQKNQINSFLNQLELAQFIQQYLQVINSFVENQVAHLNIKASNFLYTKNEQFKLSDFLIVQDRNIRGDKLTQLEQLAFKLNTFQNYMNLQDEMLFFIENQCFPDFSKDQDNYLTKIDIFCFGVVILQIVHSLSIQDLCQIRDINGLNIELQKITNEQIKNIISNLIKCFQTQQPTEQIIQKCLKLCENIIQEENERISKLKSQQVIEQEKKKEQEKNIKNKQPQINNEIKKKLEQKPDQINSKKFLQGLKNEQEQKKNNLNKNKNIKEENLEDQQEVDSLDMSDLGEIEENQQINNQAVFDNEEEAQEVRNQICELTPKSQSQQNSLHVQLIPDKPKVFKRSILTIKGFKQLEDIVQNIQKQQLNKYGQLKIYVNETLNQEEEIINFIPKVIDQIGAHNLSYLFLGISYNNLSSSNQLMNYIQNIRYLEKLEIYLRGNQIKQGQFVTEPISQLTELNTLTIYLSQNLIKKGAEVIKPLIKLKNLKNLVLCLSENRLQDPENIIKQIDKLAPQLDKCEIYLKFNPFDEQQIQVIENALAKYGEKIKYSGVSNYPNRCYSPEEQVRNQKDSLSKFLNP